MDLSKIPLLNLLSKRMSWLQARQGVLAQNVANSDTPGYQARDLKPFDFRRELLQAGERLEAARTQPMHLAAGQAGLSHQTERASQRYETSPQGNSVVLEEEMLKMADTQVDHNLTASLYRKQLGLLKMALGKAG